MVVRIALLAALGIGAGILVSCHDVVEYSSAGSFGVCIIRASDMVFEECIEGFEGGRSICSLGNTRFLVACNTGLLYEVNSEERIVEDVYEIGSPFSAGYSDMAQVNAGQVYLIGGFGKLIEFNASVGYVADEFSAGPSPVAICRYLNDDRLYVADSYDLMLREVWTSDNVVYRQLQLDGVVSEMAPYTWPVGYIAAVCSDQSILHTVDVPNFIEQTTDLVDNSSDIAILADTSIFCITHPGWGEEHGRVTLGDNQGLQPGTLTLPVSGHPTAVCSKPFGSKFYVATVLGDGTSRLLVIDGLLWGAVDSVTVEGYAWDISTHANGEYILVLTSN